MLETLDEEGKETRNPHPWRAPRKAPSKGDSSHVCSSNAQFPAFNLLIFVFVEIRRVPLVSFTNGREALRSIQCSNALRSMLVHDFSPQHNFSLHSTIHEQLSPPLLLCSTRKQFSQAGRGRRFGNTATMQRRRRQDDKRGLTK